MDKTFIMELKDTASINYILNILSVPGKDVKLIFLNGVHAKDSDKVKDGDRLGFFPPIGGG